MELKSRDPQKTHLGFILNLHTKFQLPCAIRYGDKGGTSIFQGQKKENLSYLPS